jgi:putative transposase
VQENKHFLTVARYVERNALRARMVERAQDWQWSSLWRREKGSASERGLLSEWPVPRPADWIQWVNDPQTAAETEAIRKSVNKGRPFGGEGWQKRTAAELGLESTMREQGRPRKTSSRR